MHRNVTEAGSNHHGDLAAAYDFIVIGAGSAGCVVARRLVDGSDASVLLIEAGGLGLDVAMLEDPARWPENFDAPHDWAYRYAPSSHVADRAVPLARGKVAGGSGRMNALVWARGPRSDFDGWAAGGMTGWDYESLLPHFRASEDWEDGATALRGAGGPIHVERARDLHPVSAAFIEAGLACGMPYLDDINVERPEGIGPFNLNIRDGVRSSSWEGYVRPILGHPQLTLLAHSTVTRLLFEGVRCAGVELIVGARRLIVRADREVVLCAGSIDTPRLLMLSGIGDADALRALDIAPHADLPGVGSNLQDHIVLGGLCFEAKHALPPVRHNLAGSTCFWRSRAGLEAPDIQIEPFQVPFVTPEIAELHAPPAQGFSILPGLMHVKSRGHVRLLSGRIDGPLEIQPNMLAEPEDVEALLAAIELSLEMADQPAYRELILRWAVPPGRMSRNEAVDFVRRAAMSYAHPVGTCAMGRHAGAVVDEQLRVIGVERLRIADASIMPTITSANTNAPTVMIGERAASLILGTAFPAATRDDSRNVCHARGHHWVADAGQGRAINSAEGIWL